MNFIDTAVIVLYLLTFYRSHAAALPAGTKPDAVLPIFIAHELPVGLSGLVLAAVAAAMKYDVL